MGAIAAGAVVLYFDDETNGGFGLITLALLAGAAGGSFWAAITAWLRGRYNANESPVSRVLVYIEQLVLSYLVYGVERKSVGEGKGGEGRVEYGGGGAL